MLGQTITGGYSDELKYSVGLTADVMNLAIGDPSNEINGKHSGQVKVFNVKY